MKFAKNLNKVNFMILSAWLSTTLVVDFIMMPAVFRNVSNLEEAGNVGMVVFSMYNSAEVALGLILMTLFIFMYEYLDHKKSLKPQMILIGLLILLSLSYKFYVSPKIIELRDLKNQEANMEVRQNLETKIYHYHNLYKGLDVFKIILLSALVVMSFKRKYKKVEPTL